MGVKSGCDLQVVGPAFPQQCHSPPKMCHCSPQTLVLLDGSPLVELCSVVGGGSGKLRAAERSWFVLSLLFCWPEIIQHRHWNILSKTKSYKVIFHYFLLMCFVSFLNLIFLCLATKKDEIIHNIVTEYATKRQWKSSRSKKAMDLCNGFRFSPGSMWKYTFGSFFFASLAHLKATEWRIVAFTTSSSQK